jgi:hypothetical protein
VVRHRGADDSAPDNDDAGVGGNAGGERIGSGHGEWVSGSKARSWHHPTGGA